MARLPYLTAKDLPPEHRDVVARDIWLNRVMANSPGAARAFTDLGMFIRFHSRLDPRLRQLAIMQVGWLARSPYEWSHHVRIGKEFGCTDADIRAIATETDGGDSALEPLAKLVLQGAREMFHGPGMSTETFDALRPHLDPERLTDLTVTIAYYCGVVRLLATLGVEVEPDYQPFLEEYPLP
ncbi:carboxymuconolactone decarboxylase family protein [Falsiroseomonas stagni]|uniref:Carboxymuconolactone decarboxylase family protein n=1 Tax=Falsiroseomonas stagni DSM 19981 TaxID=1123062 RepID=A0A1I4AXI9_9PROT|nr:carboxymuconolactone decarboxylase family protein [Falsiroseomonas stagni]SFK60637.1 Carboxymuconolactone decarboxylase family protein [Falsiroseomonas stagni DSM 19981]